MKYRVLWSISEDKWLPVMKKWVSMSSQERGNAGESVKIIGRWHDVVGRTGVLILESDDLAAVQRYLGIWNPHMTINITPVIDDEEAAAIGRHIIPDDDG